MTQLYDTQDVLRETARAGIGHPVPEALSASGLPQRSSLGRLLPYLAIARPDHWFKNVFMALGVFLACFYHPDLFTPATLLSVAWAVLITCLVASSNYVLNE